MYIKKYYYIQCTLLGFLKKEQLALLKLKVLCVLIKKILFIPIEKK